MFTSRSSFLCTILCKVFFSICLLIHPLWSQEPATQSQYLSVRPEPGERCAVCGAQLTEDDVTLIVRGRRVPLNQAMVDSFINNQEKYFSNMQPKSALFQEELDAPAGVAQGGINLRWFLFGMYVLVALVFGGMSGYTAVTKGLKPFPNFFIGFFLSAFGFLFVLTRHAAIKKGGVPAGLVKVPTTYAPVPCTDCGNTNHPAAKICAGCGAHLEPLLQSEVERTS